MIGNLCPQQHPQKHPLLTEVQILQAQQQTDEESIYCYQHLWAAVQDQLHFGKSHKDNGSFEEGTVTKGVGASCLDSGEVSTIEEEEDHPWASPPPALGLGQFLITWSVALHLKQVLGMEGVGLLPLKS